MDCLGCKKRKKCLILNLTIEGNRLNQITDKRFNDLMIGLNRYCNQFESESFDCTISENLIRRNKEGKPNCICQSIHSCER